MSGMGNLYIQMLEEHGEEIEEYERFCFSHYWGGSYMGWIPIDKPEDQKIEEMPF